MIHKIVVFGLLAISLEALAQRPPIRSTRFDGSTNAVVRYDHRAQFDSTVPMTIEAWVFREDATRCETIVSHNYLESYWFGFCPNLRFYRGGGRFADATRSVPAGQWTHVAVTYDGTTARFYIDGLGAGAVALSNTGANRTGPLLIGGDPDRRGFNFLGNIDEIRLWSIARPLSAIQNDRLREIPSGTGLAARFAEGGGRENISGASGRAGSGAIPVVFGVLPVNLVIPRSDVPVNLDGSIDLNTEYEGAEQMVVRFMDGTRARDAVAYLKYRDVEGDRNLYVGFQLARNPVAPATWESSYVGLMIDPNNSREVYAQSADAQVRAFLGGRESQYLVGNGGGAWVAPSFPVKDAWDVVKSHLCAGDVNPPCIEFRISKARLGEWNQTDGIAIGQFNVGTSTDDYLFPANALEVAPFTWAQATYAGPSVFTPSVTFNGFVRDLTTAGPVTNHTVWLMAEPSGALLYTTRTDADGMFAFSSVAVPADTALKLMIEECDNCRYDPLVVRESTIPRTIISPREVSFPACESVACLYPTVTFNVRTPQARLEPTSFAPTNGLPRVVLREGKTLPPDEIVLSVRNLHPFIRVYLSSCLDVVPASDCVLGRDYFEAPILRITEATSPSGEGTVLVTVPEIPRDRWNRNYHWVIHDLWERPGIRPGGLEWRAFSNRFVVEAREYPIIHGFEFENEPEGFSLSEVDFSGLWDEFDGVYGNNAYICLGAFGECICRIRDPLYIAWFFVFMGITLASDEGSCVGMASTSLLMARGALTPGSIDSDVFFAAGFEGDPPPTPGAFPRAPKPKRFDFHACSADTPRNIWAHIRSNHGVQYSAEFLDVCLDQLRGTGFLSVGGNPRGVLATVRSRPLENVICMVPGLGTGHCVTPYGIIDNVGGDPNISHIRIYDNNFPERTNRFIEINRAANTYRFPRSAAADTIDQWTGDGIYTIPRTIWERERTMPGLWEILEFVSIVVFGEANARYTSPDGEWGWKADGTPVDAMKDARAFIPLAAGKRKYQNGLLRLPTTNAPPKVALNVVGKRYGLNAAQDGVLLQIENQEGIPEQTDHALVEYLRGKLSSFSYAPQTAITTLQPRVGMVLGERQRALFQWKNLTAPAGQWLKFTALKDKRGAEFRNSSTNEVTYELLLETVDGASSSSSSNRFGPFRLAAGASIRTTIQDWPKSELLQNEIDRNNDGTTDEVFVVRPQEGGPQPDPPGLVATLSKAGLRLTWPPTPKPYALECTAKLGATPWEEVFAQIITDANGNAIVLPISDAARYYRLRLRDAN